ncbi:MAG: hypothetical protein OHK0013_23470 [Sandaracinaceae bacterium]
MNRRVLGALEILRVCAALPRVELARLTDGPKHTVPALRVRGRRCARRSADERALLRRAIAAVDGRVPGGGNCYRRVLLEIALDAGAAEERVALGVRAEGGLRSGHAWLGDGPSDDGERYDVVLAL